MQKETIIIPNRPFIHLGHLFTYTVERISLTSFLFFLPSRTSRIPTTARFISRVSSPRVTRPCIEINREDKRESVNTTYTRCRSARHWSHTRYSLRGFAAGAELSAGGRRRKWKGERLEKGKTSQGVPLAERASESSFQTRWRWFFPFVLSFHAQEGNPWKRTKVRSRPVTCLVYFIFDIKMRKWNAVDEQIRFIHWILISMY